MTQAVADVFQKLVDDGLVQNHKDTPHSGLKILYPQLDDNERRDLWLLIQAETDAEFQVDKVDPAAFHELCIEALHQGIDGYTEPQKVAIRAFLADIAMGVSVMETGGDGEG